MSGKPYPEGVAELRKQLAALRSAEAQVIRLRAEIEDRKAKLDAQNQNYSMAHKRITELLFQMDVHSTYNAGWEARMLWCLAELTEQSEQYGRMNQ